MGSQANDWGPLIYNLLHRKSLIRHRIMYVGRSSFSATHCTISPSLRCVSLCRTTSNSLAKHLPHSGQSKGFSPECVFRWRVRADVCRKHLPHSGQGKGRSPVWVRRWRIRQPLYRKHLPHCRHTWGLTMLWLLMCRSQVAFMVNNFSHSVQGYRTSPACMRRCIS